jgi:hypothetical protein
MTLSDSYSSIVMLQKHVDTSRSLVFSHVKFKWIVILSNAKYSESVTNLFSLYRAAWLMLATTLQNRPCRTAGNDPSSHELRKSSASTPISAPNMGAMNSGVMVNRVDVIDYANDFRVCYEVAHDAIAYLKPAWMYSAASRGPSKSPLRSTALRFHERQWRRPG